MIISASRRTDLPALYAEWLGARFRAGFCLVPNPMNARQVARVSLARPDVDAVVFWTRHARPAFPVLSWLEGRGYPYYFQYTILGYPRPLETRAPSLDVAVRTFRELAGRLPRGGVVWRYDPIVLGEAFPATWHRETFGRIASALEGATDTVVVSVIDWYARTRRRLGALNGHGEGVDPEPAAPGLEALLAELARIAGDHGMRAEACAEPADLSPLGIGPARCVDHVRLARLYGLAVPEAKDKGQRPLCRCIASRDIGTPDTCTFGCAYCYATRGDELARARRREHDPTAPSLVPLAADAAPSPP